MFYFRGIKEWVICKLQPRYRTELSITFQSLPKGSEKRSSRARKCSAAYLWWSESLRQGSPTDLIFWSLAWPVFCKVRFQTTIFLQKVSQEKCDFRKHSLQVVYITLLWLAKTAVPVKELPSSLLMVRLDPLSLDLHPHTDTSLGSQGHAWTHTPNPHTLN